MKLMKTSIQISFIVAVGFFSSGGLHAQLSNEKAINPGVLWMDADGKRINAHGGCVIFHEGIYYWYGEEKVEGLSEKEHADGGVHCYASKDLVAWHDQGWSYIYPGKTP
jgi:hypothetical protein